MSESFAALFEESLKRTEMRPGEVITAEVVRIEHNHVVVNAGLKSEAYVPLAEFKNDQGELGQQFLPCHQASTCSTEASMDSCELSSCRASCAAWSGATLRDMSRASRASKSARRLSILAEKPFEINCL